MGNLAAARYEVHFYKVCNLRRAPDAIHLLSLDTHALGGAGLNNAHTTGGALLVNTARSRPLLIYMSGVCRICPRPTPANKNVLRRKKSPPPQLLTRHNEMYFIYYLSHALQKSQQPYVCIKWGRKGCAARNGTHKSGQKPAERPPKSIVLDAIELLMAKTHIRPL